MKIFKINKNYQVLCVGSDTRSGFKHTATLFINGSDYGSVKINYYNRTWERYTYESVLNKLAETSKFLETDDGRVKKLFLKKIKKGF